MRQWRAVARLDVHINGSLWRSERLARPVTTIGRGPGQDVFLDHPEVSALHARLVADQEGFRLEALSSGRTRVAGRELAPGEAAPLSDGMDLVIGPFQASFHLSDSKPAASPLETRTRTGISPALLKRPTPVAERCALQV